MHRATLSFYRAQISELSNALILDLGAGSGLVSWALAQSPRVSRVIAYDSAPEHMRELSEGPKITKEWDGSHLSLPFQDCTFDAIICRYTLHHLSHKDKAVAEMHRVLKSQGVLLLSDAVQPEYSRDVMNAIYSIREDSFNGYLTYYEIIRLLEDAGFQPVLMRPYRFRYASIEKYLEAVDDGMNTAVREMWTDSDGVQERKKDVADILKRKIAAVLDGLDERVRMEMGFVFAPDSNGTSFMYYMLDLVSRKSEALGPDVRFVATSGSGNCVDPWPPDHPGGHE